MRTIRMTASVGFALAMLGLPSMAAAGQLDARYYHEVLIDVDNDATTGGSVVVEQLGVPAHPEPGFEYRAMVYDARCTSEVGEAQLWQWDGDSFEVISGSFAVYPLGTGQGLGGSQLIEWEVPSASLPEGLDGARVMFHSSELGMLNDYTDSVIVGGGGGPDLAIPTVSGVGMALLAAGLFIAAFALLRRRKAGTWSAGALLLLLAGAGAAMAGGGFVMDGSNADWADASPLVDDPAGDSSEGDANEDIFYGFVEPGESTHTFRVDVGSGPLTCG